MPNTRPDFDHHQVYMKIYQSEELPTPKSMLEVSSQIVSGARYNATSYCVCVCLCVCVFVCVHVCVGGVEYTL